MLSVLAGALLVLSFPKPQVSWVAWVGLAPLIIALRGASRARAFVYGWCFGLTFFGGVLWWVTLFGYLPWAALIAAEAFFTALFAWSAVLLCGNASSGAWLLIAPSLWVLWDWAKTLLGPLAFTWGGLGYSQADRLSFLQITSLVGVWGLTWLIALANTAIANLIFCAGRETDLMRPPEHALPPAILHLLPVGALVLLICLFGRHILKNAPPEQGRPLRVAIIQGSIEHPKGSKDYARQFEERYPAMTLKADRLRPDLILWPETVIPGYFLQEPRWVSLVADLALQTRSAILVGSQDDQGDRYYNAAFLVDPRGQVVGRYDKVRLVPFGEAVPFGLRRLLPFLERYGVPSYDLTPGPSHRPMDFKGLFFGVIICSESMFPDIAAETCRSGAQALVMITNDGWFKRTAAPEQHLQMAILRAVESRRFLARCASTGISAILNPYGHILQRADLYSRQVLTGELYPRSETTFFSRYPLTPIWLCLLVIPGALLYRWWQSEESI